MGYTFDSIYTSNSIEKVVNKPAVGTEVRGGGGQEMCRIDVSQEDRKVSSKKPDSEFLIKNYAPNPTF